MIPFYGALVTLSTAATMLQFRRILPTGSLFVVSAAVGLAVACLAGSTNKDVKEITLKFSKGAAYVAAFAVLYWAAGK